MSQPDDKTVIKSLAKGLIRRQWRLAKQGIKSGSQLMFNSLDDESFLKAQALAWSRELGQLKGSAMKAGQMLSMYGEHFFPPQVNEAFKKLQNQSPAVVWSEMEKQLRAELSPEQINQLEIDHRPLAAASIGQVHKATVRQSGEALVLKIQYPGVDQAIESELKFLRSIFRVSKIFPDFVFTDEIFNEVKNMLVQETNYKKELQFAEQYRQRLGEDARYKIPEVRPEYSSGKVLAMTLCQGARLDSQAVQSLSLERRNRLAINYLELYFKELFDWGVVQTDPHIGNFAVEIKPDGQDQLILYDFGALREVEGEFIRPYRRLVTAMTLNQPQAALTEARSLGLIDENSSAQMTSRYLQLCALMVEPFRGGVYPWAKTDLPRRVVQTARQFAKDFQVNPPPHQLVFLDRKLGGSFTFLATLKAEFDGQKVIRPFIDPIAKELTVDSA